MDTVNTLYYASTLLHDSAVLYSIAKIYNSERRNLILISCNSQFSEYKGKILKSAKGAFTQILIPRF